MSSGLRILAFDIYGTLLDTGSVSFDLRELLQLDEAKATQVTQLWRRYQLEYTWRLNSMGLYEPFDRVTWRSFLHAAADSHLAVDESTADRILERYNHLSTFDDALPALQNLSELPELRTKLMVFSNDYNLMLDFVGTQRMVDSALAGTPLSTIPHGIFVADEVKIYKPSAKIYHGLVAHVNNTAALNEGQKIDSENIWLVSGNPFDVTGARAAGLSAVWVDRAGSGWTDRIAPTGHDLKPNRI
ncbi:hypothetical protein EIP91_010257 [Steccherinum ochraceum]|uniref:Haloacid dehalogenase, type II n=1 Tax=Steccherinum ochraceum TaxID=92696 RepID=A0A4R0R312_9APHY|nr:hypothetical protein EIP91_010257 [Steccherinum ochraceum]